MADSFHHDELISAYFDGEATKAERAEVDRALEASPAVRKELRELRLLSDLIHELPPEQAPEEFRAAVMQDAERSVLLESQPAADVFRKTTRGRHWVYATLACTASAAALVVAVIFSQRPSTDELHVAANQRLAESSQLNGIDATADYAVSKAGDATNRGLPAETVTHASQPESASVNLALRDGAGSAPVSAPVDGRARSLSQADMRRQNETVFRRESAERLQEQLHQSDGFAVNAFTSRTLNYSFANRELSDVEVGEVVEALETTGDRIAVVQLTVVDRQKGLEALQLLLSRNRIELQPAEQAAVEEKKASLGVKQDGLRDELIAVYVEATGEQISTALRELHDAGSFHEIVVDRSIEVAGLNDGSFSQLFAGEAQHRPNGDLKKPIAGLEQRKAAGANQQNLDDAKPLGKSSPAATTAATPAAPTKPERAKDQLSFAADEKNNAAGKKPIASVDRNAIDEPKLRATQLQLSISSRLLAAIPDSPSPETKPTTADDAKKPAADKPAADKPADAPPVSERRGTDKEELDKASHKRKAGEFATRPVQVLFVLVTPDGKQQFPSKARTPQQKPGTPSNKNRDGAA